MNGQSNIDTNEATEHLKNILNVGKPDISMETDGAETNFGSERMFQRVELSGREESVAIYGSDVSVHTSPMHHSSSCSNIMIDNIVDYGWEQKYHLGRLVSMHLSKKYLAYANKGFSPVPITAGFVRVLKHNTNNHLLIRGFKGGAKDISFAHSLSRILLGCVDEVGELFVHEIFDENTRLVSNLCVHIIRPVDTTPSDYHRIMWCPYVPEDTSGMENNAPGSEDVTMIMSTLVVVTHDEKAEIWNIDTLIKEYGQGDIEIEKVETGLQLISEHKQPITAAAFSPDAIALATASLDGEVKFFQVNTENEESPKCLHKWTPHNGKPLSSLFFLDNHKSYNPDVQFWKFAITGADNNQELKLWSCKTWSCLQTIRIISHDPDEIQPCLKAEIDLSAGYLFLSDINRKVLYILKIHQEANSVNAFMCSLSEFPLKYPVLSFVIVDVSLCKVKPSFNAKNSADEEDEGEKDDDDEDDDDSDDTEMKRLSYLVKLFWIHTKSFQFCKILYSPKLDSPLQSAGSISSSQDSFVYRDALSDMTADVQNQINAAICEQEGASSKGIQSSGINAVLSSPSSLSAVTSLAAHRSPNYQGCSEILLTPKDFTSPHSNLPSVNIANSFKLSDIQESSDLTASGEGAEQDEQLSAVSSEQASHARRKLSQHSSASSPSREVAEILSPSQMLTHESGSVSPKMPTADEMLNNDDDVHHSPVICASPVLSQMPVLENNYLANEWPRAPDPTKEYKVVFRGDGDIRKQQSPLEQNCIRHTVESCDDAISLDALPKDGAASDMQRLEKSLEGLSLKVTAITDELHHGQEYQIVQTLLKGFQQQQKYIESIMQHVESLDRSMSNKVEHIISQNAVTDFARLESLLNNRLDSDKQRYDQQLAGLSQNLMSGMNNRLDKIVKQEMQNSVIPYMSTYLNSLVEKLQGDILQKLNSTDNALKECLGKHLRSKAFGDNLAQAAVNLLQNSMQVACKEVFQNNVVPSLEKCCQLLFSQMNEVFSKGVFEYTEKLERHQQMVMMNLDSASNVFRESTVKLTDESEQFFKKIASSLHENNLDVNNQQEMLLLKVRHIVQEENRRAMKEHASSLAAVVRSQASTPAPQNDPQTSPQQLLLLVRQGQINEAFQLALSAVDVKLVVFLCESISIEQVFGPTASPLAQHVLMSLINQLSGDLSEKTDIKVRYIEDAITSLDSSNPLTNEHMGAVLGSLQQRVTAFMKVNPRHKMLLNLRRILFSIESLLKK